MPSLELLHARVSARTTWRVVRLHDDDDGEGVAGPGEYGLGEYSDAGPAGDAHWPAVARLLADGATVAAFVRALDGRPCAILPEALLR